MTEQKFYYKSNTLKEFNCDNNDEKLIHILNNKGYNIYSIKQKTNQLIPYHEHPSEEMVIVLSGKIRYVVEEEVVDLEEGDVIKVKPHSIHSMISIAEETYSNLLLIFL
ncbi:cupin domain-containing protein [Brachyspira pilosicoli WesB]|uniref:Cupin 2 conserved barrel domain protein n=5 Tax=Brachyspira pilosicoli TaxID=52584 RepID=A0A3B6VPS5_BRAPL|nr:cupin domain-containing protein [Brachyspira pilosicoli]AFR69363.1 cupin domain-containing protein [Brachyspira pilosicoli B2904]AGA66984.1 Cupin 2 conserved barrel domain protein [Brachyspira pilosicoli P43/6/78]MBW5378033.1 cupin domain-containing protein [Brachyspira pilosicoli]MBW5383492.1 cupin domain-containing protein [Brachyspira pilosicoli]MBW5392523.1 cupin domain-containing protein [Brachyspira pilosicoli]